MMDGMHPLLQTIFLAAAEAETRQYSTFEYVMGWITYFLIPVGIVAMFGWLLWAFRNHTRGYEKHRERIEAVLERIAVALERKQ
jgi:hypothetical protein